MPRDREQVRKVLYTKIRQSTLDSDGRLVALAVVWRDTSAVLADEWRARRAATR